MSEEPIQTYESLLTRKQAAEMLKVSVGTIINLEKQGKIPRVELSPILGRGYKGVRYRASSLQSFIEGNEIFIRPER